MPRDLDLEQGVGVLVIGDFFLGQKGDEAFLEEVEAAFDFAFGVGWELHPMQTTRNRSSPSRIRSIRGAGVNLN